MNSTQSSSLSLRECYQALRRHWWKIVALQVLALALAAAMLAVYPKTFQSSTKLYVRLGRQNAALDPTVPPSQMVMVQKSQDNEINSLLDILESRWMAEQVVNSVGIEKILAGGDEPSADDAQDESKFVRYVRRARDWVENTADQAIEAVSYPTTDLDRAIKRVSQGTEVWAPKESTVVTIRCSFGSPELAQEIASSMADHFLEAHVKLNATEGTHEFFAEQAEILHEKLLAANQALRDRKNSFGLLSIEGTRDAVQTQSNEVRLALDDTQRQLAAAESRVATLREQLATVPPESTQTARGIAFDAWDRMREKLYDLDVTTAELRTKYTSEYPLLAAAEKQREEAAQILKEQPLERTQVVSNPNPTHESLDLELRKQLAEVAALRSSQEVLVRQSESLAKRMKAINNEEYNITQLQREAAVLESDYHAYLGKLEQARIDDALDSQRISSLNVVQPATFEGKPSSPKRAYVILSALVVATFGGLAFAAVGEYGHRTPPDPTKSNGNGELPVLASIPNTNQKRVRSNGDLVKT